LWHAPTNLGFRFPERPTPQAARRGLTHPADTSRSNLADALGVCFEAFETLPHDRRYRNGGLAPQQIKSSPHLEDHAVLALALLAL
jgi:hypothetical protein